MKSPHILLLEREPLIADDLREEILTMAKDAVVEIALSLEAAAECAVRMERIDLLIVSNRSGAFTEAPAYDGLAEAADSILLIGDAAEPAPDPEPVHVARTPFTSSSLREDLQGITVAGAPLFPQRSRARPH